MTAKLFKSLEIFYVPQIELLFHLCNRNNPSIQLNGRGRSCGTYILSRRGGTASNKALVPWVLVYMSDCLQSCTCMWRTCVSTHPTPVPAHLTPGVGRRFGNDGYRTCGELLSNLELQAALDLYRYDNHHRNRNRQRALLKRAPD
jgi:hypothetical protein